MSLTEAVSAHFLSVHNAIVEIEARMDEDGQTVIVTAVYPTQHENSRRVVEWRGKYDTRRKGYEFSTSNEAFSMMHPFYPLRGAYDEWCMDPRLCHGKGYCPRDPTCAD